MTRIAALLEPQIPALRRYAFALTRDPTAADDLVQDTLERAISRWLLRAAVTRTGDAALRPWLFAILHNLFIDGQRAHRRRPLHEALDDEADQAGTPATQEAGLAARETLAQFGTLSQEHQAVLLLVGVEGLGYASVAHVLGVPQGTVMSRLSRAREQFRRLMDGERAPRHPHARPDLKRVK